MTTSTAPLFLTLAEAAVDLRVCHQLVRDAIARGRIVNGKKAVINYGTEKKPRWHFDRALLPDWWREYGECQASASESSASGGAHGKSGGATPTASSGHARIARARSPKRTRPKSKQTSPSESGGSLVTLARTTASRNR